MKKLVIVVVILVALLLVAPFGIGKLAERRVDHGLDKLLEQAPYLTVVDRQWTAGWFKSEQVVTFEMFGTWMNAFTPKAIEEQLRRQAESANENVEPSAQSADPMSVEEGTTEEPPVPAAPEPVGPIRFTVRNDILHGPLLGLSGLGVARVDSHLVLSEELEEEIAAFFGTKDLVEVSTRVGFFGGATTVFRSEGRTVTPADGKTEISWDSFKFAVGYSRNLDSYDLAGKWPRFEVKSPADGGLMRMSGMTASGDATRVRGDLYDGEFDFRIGEFVLAADGKEIAVDDVHYVVISDSKDDFTSFGIKMGSGAVKNADLAQVGVEFKAVHYDFSVRRLHTDTLVKVLEAVKASYSKPVANLAELESTMFTPLKEQGLELLKHDPEFVLDRIGVDTDSGDGYLTGIIKLEGVTADDLAVGTMAMVGKIDADLTIDVARSLIEKFGGAVAVAGALESGYVEVKGDRLVCQIVFKEGELTINGKPQAIPGLGGPPPPQE